MRLEKRDRIVVFHALDRKLGFGIYFRCNRYAEVMTRMIAAFGLYHKIGNTEQYEHAQNIRRSNIMPTPLIIILTFEHHGEIFGG